MRSRLSGKLAAVLLFFFLASMTPLGIRGASAAGTEPPGPDRFDTKRQIYTIYEWWLISWGSNSPACVIKVDHSGVPGDREINAACDPKVYQAWIATTSCAQSEQDPSNCQGYYLVLIGTEQATRPAVLTQFFTSYQWWLTSWATNRVACTIRVRHNDIPTGDEIRTICGTGLYNAWLATGPCTQEALNGSGCSGYYLVFFKSEQVEYHTAIELPPPVVWVTLQGCVPVNSTFRCDTLPSLVLTGDEPIDGEHITGIAGDVNGKPFTCDAVCQVDLVPTGDNGISLDFWAYSSYGDSSVKFQARVRVIPQDDSTGHYWFTDVISRQWHGVPLASGSVTWDVFPPVGGVPAWLATPLRAIDLATNIPYTYLTAHLIKSGVADASNCADGGLKPDGSASQCGLDVARPWVTDWQNRFDSLIFSTAQTTGIPAELLKNIFARESQFWPGVSSDVPEAGLGQMTVGGADTTLLWNQTFFEQFCSTVMDKSVCGMGYSHLPPKHQQILDQALVKSVDAFCQECPLGIDINRAENSVNVFAQTLLANTEQTGMIIYNSYGIEPGKAASYEDLWRFTLVNYNAGPGCLTLAIRDLQSKGETLTWDHLSTHFTPVCRPTVDYVNGMSSPSQ